MKSTIFFTIALVAPLMLAGQSAKMNTLLERRGVVQRNLSKVEAEQRSADSLLSRSSRLDRESRFEKEGVLTEKAKLEKRVAEAEKQSRYKKADIYNAYNDDLKVLQERESIAKQKMEESERCYKHGKERRAKAKKAVKEATSKLKDLDKEIAKLEKVEAEKAARNASM
jgi:chromosome segregation ATPase